MWIVARATVVFDVRVFSARVLWLSVNLGNTQVYDSLDGYNVTYLMSQSP